MKQDHKLAVERAIKNLQNLVANPNPTNESKVTYFTNKKGKVQFMMYSVGDFELDSDDVEGIKQVLKDALK